MIFHVSDFVHGWGFHLGGLKTHALGIDDEQGDSNRFGETATAKTKVMLSLEVIAKLMEIAYRWSESLLRCLSTLSASRALSCYQ